jgi:nitrile hydratase subunit alpha
MNEPTPDLSSDHGHEHEHDHTPIEDQRPRTRYQLLGQAVEELLIEKGILEAEDLRRFIEFMDARTPALGARVVARAWTDPEFRRRLLEDGTAAVESLGIQIAPTRLMVVENTPEVHNLVVCTLCSCYPRMLLGLPPDWYKSRPYRSRAVREPRAVLESFGTRLAPRMRVQVHDSTADLRYLVLPMRPAGTEGWDEEALAALVGRDAMIGVTVCAAPGASTDGLPGGGAAD